ncbi:MAG: hypothetical protein EB156_03700 [Euryarchaeota archaeon]|nr:hypothetical protein [Euryarchaeota archaeon]NDF22476.1 hypothetical protein [Euryarchaeota archaeon]NDF36878.1 hypothetical protein [Euryarchaeota archaeon]
MGNRVEPTACVILGRFQPVHLGHALLIEGANNWRLQNRPDLELRIAVGSVNKPQDLRNPWNYDERREMLRAALDEMGLISDIVPVPDIDDPPNWVKHAEAYHGGPGALVTTDQLTAKLYSDSGWEVALLDYHDRGDLVGWRVRETLRMMSTISDEDAIHEVLSKTMQKPVIDKMIQMDAVRRLAFMGEGGEPVG